MNEPLTVTQLNTKVRTLLQSTPEIRDIWVSGEISNLKRATSGHYYFVLKDETGAVACALFARARARVDFEPRENMKVLAFGSADLYVQRGSYQFIVENMRQSGLGELFQAFEELKRRLEAEGLFAHERKRPLPAYPRTIGVVTSETGAVIHDIITTSASRFPADILLAPAQVQGEGAARTIVAGIELLNRVGVDVIIVGRGGGSLEDLWPFNEEPVARAIAASRVPVVSAVGHETDFTIADFVADVRAPTPTGAAAIILRDRKEIREQIARDMLRADRALRSVLDGMRSRFDVLDARLSPESASRDLDMRGMELDDLWRRADKALTDQLNGMRVRLSAAEAGISPAVAMADIRSRRGRLESVYSRVSPAGAAKDLGMLRSGIDGVFGRIGACAGTVVAGCGSRLSTASASLESLNPRRVMERGYGIITRPDGQVITTVSDMLVGEKIDIRLRDGTARTSVREIREDSHE